MSLRNILARFRIAGQNALDLAMTVESRPSSLVNKDFREFTAPMRQQRGGALHLALHLASHKGDRLRRIGTIPDLGGNVP
ncbi:hypothetical protein [Stenotrophomonas indicatrix]|uniref:Uncharacterized protein n=1 Tax=Stenotrophomonas indicatrix TaxID=2045451 RepID=A0ABT8QGC8_9GAMM|nr:hypothetical protein [Stenotrophomonas indicatrix]MDN8662267.1 hypothetical protein [Stenotrophomonas indicatrix]MDN8669902.1 hypothetical protein [Stenotrophomonas indicatrix]